MDKSEKLTLSILGVMFVVLASILMVMYISVKVDERKYNTASAVVDLAEHKVIAEENIKIEIPASVTEKNDVEIKITKHKVDYSFEKRKDYIEGLIDYQGNVDFQSIYDCAKYWTNEYNINLDFFLALMYVESNYKTTATSYKNCRGLGQVSHDALDQFNAAMWKDRRTVYTWGDMYDYERNIEVACWYLDWLWEHRIQEVGNSSRRYIQSYNYGRTGVRNAINKNEYTYADKIITLRDKLKAL